jgi:hypothetical protein
MDLPDKAVSVGADGQADGFRPTPGWLPEVIPGSHTRLVVSLPGDKLEAVHRALVATLNPPLRVMVVQLVDRAAGRQLDPPLRFVALDVPPADLDQALAASRVFIYHDGRHQLWVQGSGQDRIVLEETGVVYVYPDDPLFRDTLVAAEVPEHETETMATRDYVRVSFTAAADAEEVAFKNAVGLVPYGS